MLVSARKWKILLVAIVTAPLLYLGARQVVNQGRQPRPPAPPRQLSSKPSEPTSPLPPIDQPAAPEPWFLPRAELLELATEPPQQSEGSVPSFDELKKRMESDGVDAVIESLTGGESTPACERLRQALDLSRHILRDNPQQLWFQLFARTRMASSLEIDQMLSQVSSQSPQSRLSPRFLSLDQAGGPLLRVMAADNFGVLAVAVSPDGERFVSGHGNGTLTMWELATGQPIWTVKGHDSSVDGVAFAPDGKSVGGVSNDKSAVIWNAEDGAKKHSIKIRSNGAYALAFSPDGQTLAIGSDGFASKDPPDDMLTLWNYGSGQTRVLRGHTMNVKSVAFSPDGKWLTTGSHDRTIKIWDVDKGTELRSIEAFDGAVSSVVYSSDGKTIAASSFSDPTIKLFSSETGDAIGNLTGHRQGVTQLAFSHRGTQLASGGQDGRVKLWDTATQSQLAMEGVHTHLVNAVQFTPDDHLIVSGSSDKTIRIWRQTRDAGITPPTWHAGFVHGSALSADGKFLATGGGDEWIRIWDAQSGSGVKKMTGPFKSTTRLVFSPEGDKLATLHGDRTLRIWDIASGRVSAQWMGPKGPHFDSFPGMSRLVSLAFSPDGGRIAAAGHSSLTVWDVASKDVVFELQGHENIIRSLAFSPDGSRLASASGDKTIRLWDMASGEQVLRIATRAFPRSILFSSDGTSLFVGGSTRVIEQLDAKSGEVVRAFRSQGDIIEHLALIADGRVLALVDFSGIISFWEIASGKLLERYHLDQRFSTFAGHPSGLLGGAGSNGRIHAYDWTFKQGD